MQTLFENGTILTMNTNNPTAQALLMEDGVIIAVGSKETVASQCKKELKHYDLQGNTLLPAFIDGHSHIVQYAKSLQYAQLHDVNSFESLLSTLQAFYEENPPADDQWLIGVGYDVDRLLEKQHPTADLLDTFPCPVMITTASGHMGCLNHVALSLCHITKDSPVPVGGFMGRTADGAPNGYLEENAFFATMTHISPPSEKKLLTLLQKAQGIYASYGIAVAQEGLLKPEDVSFLQKANQQNALQLAIVGYGDIRAYEAFDNVQSEGNFHFGGYKLLLDGSPQGRTAWLTTPYENSTDCGYPVITDAEVKHFVSLAKKKDKQLLTHCNGDAAIDQLLRAHEEPSAFRNVIIHAQLMREDQLAKAKALSLIPSFFVAHVHRYGEIHIQNLGLARASQISPLASAVKEHIPFTLHQDTPVMLPDMLHTLYCATCRQTEQGTLLGDHQRISLMDALKAVTYYGAYQHFMENDIGTLTAGKQANLTLVTGDLTKMNPYDLPKQRVLATFANGCVLDAHK